MRNFAKMRPETVILIFFPISSHTPYHLHFELRTQRKAQINITLLTPCKTSQWITPSHAQRAVLPDTYSTGWKTGRWNSRSQRPELTYLIGSCYSRLMISIKQERIQFPWCSYYFMCALLGNVSYIQNLKSSHCDLPTIIMQPDVQKTTWKKKNSRPKWDPLFLQSHGLHLKGNGFCISLEKRQGRQAYCLEVYTHTSTAAVQILYKVAVRPTQCCKVCGPLCSELFAAVIPHTSWSNHSLPLRREIPVPLTRRPCSCTDSDKSQTSHLLTHPFLGIELIGAK